MGIDYRIYFNTMECVYFNDVLACIVLTIVIVLGGFLQHISGESWIKLCDRSAPTSYILRGKYFYFKMFNYCDVTFRVCV